MVYGPIGCPRWAQGNFTGDGAKCCQSLIFSDCSLTTSMPMLPLLVKHRFGTVASRMHVSNATAPAIRRVATEIPAHENRAAGLFGRLRRSVFTWLPCIASSGQWFIMTMMEVMLRGHSEAGA